jgi:hypothetical protein
VSGLTVPVAGVTLFGVSVVAAVAPAWWIAVRTSSDVGARYWTALAFVALDLGLTAQSLSAFHALRAGPWLAAQALLAFVPVLVTRVIVPSDRAAVVPSPRRATALSLALVRGLVLAAVAAGLVLSAARQWRTPVQAFDDVAYHGPRVLFWLQQRAIAPYTSNYDLQAVFPYGGEIFFLWSLLFARWERLARMVMWLALPALAGGSYALGRELGLGRAWACATAALLVWTPMVRAQALGIKPDLWATVYLLGAAFWLVRAVRDERSARPAAFWSLVLAVLGVNAKLTLLPVLIVLAIVLTALGPRMPVLRAAAAGTILAMACSGLGQVFVWNQARYGHPMGPAAMRRIPRAEISPRQVAEHAARASLLLLDLPSLPIGAARRLGDLATRLLAATTLDRPLPGEQPVGWPGRYSPEVATRAERFSIAGLLWPPAAGVALWRARRRADRLALGIAAVALLSVAMATPILFLVRWQASAAVPDRFLTPPFALGAAALVALLADWSSRARAGGIAAAALLGWAILPQASSETERALAIPATGETRPYVRLAERLPPGSRIIHLGGISAEEYFLFAPRQGFTNAVSAWGYAPFDVVRLRRMIEDVRATHVVVQDSTLSFHWRDPIDMAPALRWLAATPGFEPWSADFGTVRVFAVKDEARTRDGAESSDRRDLRNDGAPER